MMDRTLFDISIFFFLVFCFSVLVLLCLWTPYGIEVLI